MGYIFEELLAFSKGKIVNRGFLQGPYLPIYGIGALLLLKIKKYKKNPFLIFMLSSFYSILLEGISGFLIYNFFNKRLWNYEDEFLNIGGFVCFKSFISFGIGGVIFIYLIEPIVLKLTKRLSYNKCMLINLFIFNIFMIDFLTLKE